MVTKGINPPEDQRKIQIFNNMLLHHRNKTQTEHDNTCGIRCISKHIA